jgi:hypothetical protein
VACKGTGIGRIRGRAGRSAGLGVHRAARRSGRVALLVAPHGVPDRRGFLSRGRRHDRDVHLNVIGPGEWFGEIGLLQMRPRVATVASCTDAVVWRIPGETFLSALQEVAAEPSALVEVMADRLGRLPPG